MCAGRGYDVRLHGFWMNWTISGIGVRYEPADWFTPVSYIGSSFTGFLAAQ